MEPGPGSVGRTGPWAGQGGAGPPSPSPVQSLLCGRREKAVVTIAGLGNEIWSSYLHSGGAREAEDTNRRFRSLQPSPEKKQKVSSTVVFFSSNFLVINFGFVSLLFFYYYY